MTKIYYIIIFVYSRIHYNIVIMFNSLPDSLDFVLDTWHTIGHSSNKAIDACFLGCSNN